MTTDSTPAGSADPAAALAERLFHDVTGALELFTVYLGERLGLYRALAADGPATSAELAERTGTEACGTGWSSIAMARAYPLIRVDGFDTDPDAIAAACRHAEQEGVADRTTFAATDVSSAGISGQFDLVTVFEGLHDMSRPVDVLRAARHMLAPSGSVVIADELVADQFTAPASDLERHHYGWSVVCCLPGAMGDPGTAATGAVMRPATLGQYALQAGFGGVEVLPLQTETWRFYRLTP
jgi:SAM-dependent methyltransferase